MSGTGDILGNASIVADGLHTVANFVTEVIPSLGEDASIVSKFAGEAFGKVLVPVAVIATGLVVKEGIENHDAAKVAGAGGSLLGGIAVGAAAGALLGVEGGPLALATGLAGGVVGGIVGEKAAKEFLTDTVATFMGPKEHPAQDKPKELEAQQLAALHEHGVLPETVKLKDKEVPLHVALRDPDFNKSFRESLAASEQHGIDAKPLLAKIDEFDRLEKQRGAALAQNDASHAQQKLAAPAGRSGGQTLSSRAPA